jgi:hypothetical protein
MIIGIDVGYGYTKAYTKIGHLEQRIVFPSHVSELIEESDFAKFDCININGQRYLAGETVIKAGYDPVYTVTSDFVGSDYYMVLLAEAISSFKPSPEEDFTVVIGLPPGTYSKENIERINYALKTKVPVVVKDSIEYAINIKKLFCVPQGVGGYIAASYDYPEIKGKKAVVFDLGYHTLDTVIIRGMRYTDLEYHSAFIGVKDLYDKIKAKVMRQYSLSISDDVVEQILKNGKFSHFGKDYTISVDDLIEQYLKKIQNYLKTFEIKVKTETDVFLFCGGGAGLLFRIWRGKISPATGQIVKDSTMANARGYWIYGAEKLNLK